MISKRQWQRCMAKATNGKTLRESINEELQSTDKTINDCGVQSMYATRIDGTWTVCINGTWTSGGYAGLSDIISMIARTPIAWDEPHDPRRDG
tara:strand:+ start:196 stop:474 length:279 start_codon:yes stop_codon:yes gene_type:complete